MMMTADLPKIWNTTFPSEMSNVRKIDFHLPDNDLQKRVALSNSALYPDGNPLTADLVPDYMFFIKSDLTEAYRSGSPDWFRIGGGLHVVSAKFRNFLSGFGLGSSQFFEVPLYEFDQKTLRPGRWFIFHICETKETLVAAQSTGLELRGTSEGLWRSHIEEDVLAARASSAEGADLWIDLQILGRIFLSDRLKSALRPAGIRASGLTLRPCIVVA
jgi:hypothetical protein